MRIQIITFIVGLLIAVPWITYEIYVEFEKPRLEYEKIQINHVIKYMYYRVYKGAKEPIVDFGELNDVGLYCVGFQELSVNDSIVKNAGTLRIQVYRKGKKIIDRNCGNL